MLPVLSLLESRVLGVLVEKERTVPDSYPLTLRAWRAKFLAADLDAYDERFRRMWELYLCWAEGGFLERRTEDHQLLFVASAFEDARRHRVEEQRRAA